jgi:hypothetical protein
LDELHSQIGTNFVLKNEISLQLETEPGAKGELKAILVEQSEAQNSKWA